MMIYVSIITVKILYVYTEPGFLDALSGERGSESRLLRK